jgi:hypothetical protein
MSAGFGGRLLGAFAAGVNYIGFDPSGETFRGLEMLARRHCPSNLRVLLYQQGSETMDLGECADFAFTSPPYFNTERYSEESTQSCVRFTTPTDWINGFLRPTFLRTNRALRQNARMAINIANVPSFKDLEEQAVRVAEEGGFKLEETLRLALSNSKLQKDKESAFKYEPVFVFRKIL